MPQADSSDGRYTRHEERRQEILSAAIDYVFSNGLSELSMRPMAEALGISHRTLLHHFGSKEELIARVLREVRSRELEKLRQYNLDEATDPITQMDMGWALLSKPERMPFWRAYFEIYGIAVKNADRYSEFLDSAINVWLPSMVRAVMDAGVPAREAEQLSSLMLAGPRGLIIDLLTTGDHRRVNAAYAMYREMMHRELEARSAMRD